MFSSLNGSSNKLWEEANECRKGDEIGGRFHFSSINIYAITQCLKSVEADAYWQDDVKRIDRNVLSKERKSFSEVVNKEVVIFEKS